MNCRYQQTSNAQNEVPKMKISALNLQTMIKMANIEDGSK